jgi:ElaA protein
MRKAHMELIVKHFSELSAEELFEIYKLRVSVFIVEQSCPYQDIDDADKSAYHVWLRDEDGIEAYARVLPAGVAFPTAAFGRVIAVKRRCGLGTKIVTASIEAVRDKLGADMITIEAQVYARSLYENLGFRQTSEEFLEDGIPHIQMQLEL